MKQLEEKTIKSNEIFRGNILNVRVDEVRVPNGNIATREIVEHSGGVSIIPITETGEIVLVEQFRKPAEEMLLELPAGKLEPDEEPEICAGRELMEETGYRAEQLMKLFSFYTSPGYSNEILHLYLARDLEFVQKSPDEDEFLITRKIKPSQIMDFIFSGQVKDSKTIIGLLYYLRVM